MKLTTLALTSALALRATADNPIVQTLYTADPAALVHNGRVYLYTGHDENGAKTFVMKDWRVFSSVDMVNWQDHGSPMSLATFKWATAQAWAGHAIERNGRFYWYVVCKIRVFFSPLWVSHALKTPALLPLCSGDSRCLM
jgi:beta-xylosidase